jgi:hypothetical protein
MFDPLRTDSSRALDAASDPDRNAKIEQLLLGGLDCYFAGQYEQAINVWTRALFLDRSHARARAYIERARRALAERQRESEELLQSGVAAFNRGEGGEARRLITDAIDRGAPVDEALAILGRLDRIQHRPVSPLPGAAVGEALPNPAPPPARRGRRSAVVIGAAVIAVAALVTVAAWSLVSGAAQWQVPLTFEAQPPPPPAPRGPAFQPTIPLRGEMTLARARALAAGGRLHDAIAMLERVRPTDAQKEEADELRASLQRELIALTLSAETAAADHPSTEEPVR